MQHLATKKTSVMTAVRALIVMAVLAASFASAAYQAPVAEAQATTKLEVWGKSGGAIDNPKQWKLRQSTSAANDLGTANAAALGLDVSSWDDVNVRWRTFPGPNVANHFRKDFTLAELDVEGFQVVGMEVSLQYDDSAIMYLNGQEVYRSIRGNLDPSYNTYPRGANMPFNVNIPFGGAEELYVGIPDVNGTNDCEEFPGCTRSPYGGPNPPVIPASLLNDTGVNTWAITTWNQSGGGSGDSSFDHTFDLLIDEDAIPPNPIFINEVMASNQNAFGLQLDDDPEDEFPDWFELINTSNAAVNLEGWTISDDSDSWVFPSVSIAANDYLVVVANKEDLRDTPVLQTNFKISAEGDTLKLTNPAGFVADEYGVLPQQFEDNSYGRPNDTGATTYLATYTPGESNGAAGNGYTPILRPFANRMYNVGEVVTEQVTAFDPDGDALTFSLTPMPPGLSVSSDGMITGTLATPGSFTSTIRVTDADNDSATQLVQWVVLDTPAAPAPLVLNEYNAVADDRELTAGSPLGNGGEWFEFLVIEDQLDLRGYEIELYDRKGLDDQLRLAASVVFGTDVRLARAPAGTIITISEELPNNLSFNGNGDWHINFNITAAAEGAYFADPSPTADFNSTRSGQTVLIKNAAGEIVTPLSGETDGWDGLNGGVSGGEVMSLCVNPTPGFTLDPLTDYSDNGRVSTFGEPNVCTLPDPVDPLNTVTFNQSLTTLRSSATFGASSGDVNCDLRIDIGDALITAQYSVGTRTDTGPCFFNRGGANQDIYVDGADINQDDSVTIGDALILARCSVGLSLPWCPR